MLIGFFGTGFVAMETPWRFQYVYQVRDGVEPWRPGLSLPLYEVMRSPSEENLVPEFRRTNHTAYLGVSEWNRHVGRENLQYDFPDGTELHLSSKLTEADRAYLVQEFMKQRGARSAAFWKSIVPWVLWALLPPVFVLSALWFGRRFAEAVR